MADTVMADRVVQATANGIIEKFTAIPSQPHELEPAENETIIEALRWIDTIHDFFPVNLKSARGEDIRDILRSQFGNDISQFFEKISVGTNKIGKISPSSPEVQTEAFYHTNFNTINIGNHVIDVKTITDKYIKNKDTTAAQILEEVGIQPYQKSEDLQLTLTDRSVFKGNKPATNFLGNVILSFFFGEDINRDVYFLIDAQAGRLDCMLQDIDQVNTLINVLTIGDSAITSTSDVTKTKSEEKQDCGVEDFNNKFKRKVYFESPNTIPKKDGDRYSITSNEFTKHQLNIWYQDADLPFSKQNNASARLYVNRKNTDQTWFSEFSFLAKKGTAARSPNSGASVGTLKQLITIIDQIGKNFDINAAKKAIFNFYKYETEFNLTPILCGMIDAGMPNNDIIRFLYDYKRGGDHEQVNSANYLYKQGLNVILLTGDRLCSLYARLIGQPCIYIHKDEYDMYRFLRATTDAQKIDQANNVLEARKRFIQAEMEKIQPAEIIKQLDDLNGQLKTLIDSLVDKFEDKLYNFIFVSLIEKINRIKLNLENRYGLTSAEMLAYKDKLVSGTTEEEIKDSIKTLNDTYSVFYNENKEIFNFALYYSKETKKITKDNFISKALDYDNLLIKQILSFFTIKSLEIKPKYKEDRKDTSKSYTETMKRNIIGRFGGDFITLIMDEYLKYLKKCIENSGGEIDEDKLSAAARARRSEIDSQTNGIITPLTPDGFETSTYATYNPIFDGLIKAFMIDYINTPPVKEEIPMELTAEETPVEPMEATPPVEATPVEATPVEATPVEATPVEATPVETLREEATPIVETLREEATPMAETIVETTPSEETSMAGGGNANIDEENENIKIMKLSLYEWFKSINTEKLRAINADLVSIYEKIPVSIKEIVSATGYLKIYKERKIPENTGLTPTELTKRKKEEREEDELLKERDIELNEIITIESFIEILNFRLTYEYYLFYGRIPKEEINLYTAYIEPLLAKYYHDIQTLHFDEMVNNYLYDTKAVENTRKEHIKYLYDDVEKLYPDTVYEYLYKGIKEQRNPETNKSVARALESLLKKVSVKDTSIRGIEQKEARRSNFSTKSKKSREKIMSLNRESVPDIYMMSPLEEEVVGMMSPLEEEVVGVPSKKSRVPRVVKKSSASKSRGQSSRVPFSKGNSRRFIPLEGLTEEVPSGGKRTRKYKNKRNKKTRQQRKKTRKNKTLKKRREKGKQRTRRNF
jgi:hypothetical protein